MWYNGLGNISIFIVDLNANKRRIDMVVNDDHVEYCTTITVKLGELFQFQPSSSEIKY